MANPNVVVCAKNTIVKVATSVKTGVVHVLDDVASYSHTYRDTGHGAPTDIREFRGFTGTLLIGSVSNIDVYVLALGADGKVRVDL